MAAKDGKRFQDASDSTQEAFKAVYGSNAESSWENEHNSKLGGGSSKSSSSNGSNSNNDDGRDAFTQSAGNLAKQDADRNATSRYASDSSAGASRYSADASAGASKYSANLSAKTQRYGIDVGAQTAANELEQAQEQFDATLKFKLKELLQERERIEIERGRAVADAWFQQQEIRLADQTHGLAVSQLGLDYLKTDVEFRSSPDNYFKLADFEAGARERQDVPIFLQNLLKNVQGPAYQAPGGYVSAPGGIGTGIAALGGSVAPVGGGYSAAAGTGGWSGQDVSALNSIAQIQAEGAHKLAPGSLERLSGDNRALLGAGIARLGGSAAGFSDAYLRSRPGQQSARLA